MRRVIGLIFLLLTFQLYSQLDTEYNIIKSGDSRLIPLGKLDINSCTYDDMIQKGIRKNIAQKIIEYREITGGFSKLADMKRINGIGKATYEKIKEQFDTPKSFTLKKININEVDDRVLSYFSFSKKEIKKIRDYQNKNGKIRSSLELKKIVPKNKYERLVDFIEY